MKLNLLVQPAAEVCIGNRDIYLYPPGIGEVEGYSGVGEEVDVTEKFRMLLTLIASLSVPKNFREKRELLAYGDIEKLDAEELEVLACAYISIPFFDKVRTGSADGNVAPVARCTDESAMEFLDRLMNAEAERQRRIFEKINFL